MFLDKFNLKLSSNIKNFIEIQSNFYYLALSLLFSIIFILFFSIYNNLTFIIDMLLMKNTSIISKLNILIQTLPFISLNYTTITSSLVMITSILLGFNISILIYNFKKDPNTSIFSISSLGSLLFGVLGSGCASCGAGILAGIFSLFGISGVLTILPLEGQEIFLISILIVLISLYYQTKDSKCSIDLNSELRHG